MAGHNHTMDLPIPPTNLEMPLPGRRALLRAAACLPAMGLLIPSANAQTTDFWNRPRELWLHRKSTGEQVKEVYWADGKLIPDSYVRICRVLRDVQASNAVQMDIVLLDIMRGIYGWFEAFGVVRPLIINSGYRTSHTNNLTEGAAKNSMHKYGKAADLYMEGISTDYMAKLGLYLAGGGVGFYPNKKFVHVDSGRLRTWRG